MLSFSESTTAPITLPVPGASIAADFASSAESAALLAGFFGSDPRFRIELRGITRCVVADERMETQNSAIAAARIAVRLIGFLTMLSRILLHICLLYTSPSPRDRQNLVCRLLL